MSTKSEAPAQERKSIALCWFQRESYDSAKALMADPDRLYGSFDDWLRAAKSFEAEMATKHITTKRVRFHAPAFILFCKIRNIVPDAGARLLWASQEAQKG